jgi:ParB family chromosome partitioning protein
MEKKALGKGLNALFEQAPPAIDVPQAPAVQIRLDEIVPNRYQPRRDFDEAALEQLAQSLKDNGVLQPIAVRPHPMGGYELIAGERRWRAAQRAGLAVIPAVVRPATDQQLALWALVENLQREDLNPIEAARAYRRLIDEFRLTQEEVARQVGKDRSTVANLLRLLGLPDELQRALAGGALDVGHAKALLALSDARQQLRAAQRVMRRGLSVRATEGLVARLQQPRAAKANGNVELAALEERLRRRLGTKAQILAGRSGGRIVIHYYDGTDLGRLIDLLS